MDSRDLKELVNFSPDRIERETVHESLRLWSELVCLTGPQKLGPIRDEDSDALFLVVAGEAAFQVDSKRKRVKQWSTVLVPAGVELLVSNASTEPLVLLVVAAPPPVPREVTG
jgi:mannose-6-phosphate isomerase-like protein (cupin superfamily)